MGKGNGNSKRKIKQKARRKLKLEERRKDVKNAKNGKIEIQECEKGLKEIPLKQV